MKICGCLFFWGGAYFNLSGEMNPPQKFPQVLVHSCIWKTVGKLSISKLFNPLIVSDSFRPHGLRHSRLPCPSLFPGVCSHSCPLSQWYHLTISYSGAPFFCPQSPSIRVRSSASKPNAKLLLYTPHWTKHRTKI